jgi:hypothetical protein
MVSLIEKRMIYEQTIRKWGIPSQMLMFIEESDELSHELLKAIRGKADQDKIIEEMVDVQITFEQQKIIILSTEESKDKFEKIYQEKIERLKKMVEEN